MKQHIQYILNLNIDDSQKIGLIKSFVNSYTEPSSSNFGWSHHTVPLGGSGTYYVSGATNTTGSINCSSVDGNCVIK